MSSPQEQVASDYDASAVAYSRHWGPGLNVIATSFLDEIPLPQSGVIADVGTGAGGLLPALEERTQARLLALDVSLGMLRLAEPRHWRVIMDGQRLAIRDNAVDAVTAMFVLFHLPNPRRGLQEFRRVLRPGGICAFTAWGEDDPDFAAFDVVDEVLNRHGAAEGRRIYSRYEELDTADKCREALASAGFVSTRVAAVRMAYPFTVEDLIGFRTGVGCGRARFSSVPHKRRPAALSEMREALSQLTPGELTLRDEVIRAYGRVDS